MISATCKRCGATFYESSRGARGVDLCDEHLAAAEDGGPSTSVGDRWNAMRDAPRDGTPLLLVHAGRGVVEGLFSPSHWTEGSHVSPSEFQGAVWLIGTDQEEEIEVVENGPHAPEPYDDGPLVGWLSRTTLPDAPENKNKDR